MGTFDPRSSVGQHLPVFEKSDIVGFFICHHVFTRSVIVGRLAAIRTKSIAGIDLTMAEVDATLARTRPQVEVLKRLIGAK